MWELFLTDASLQTGVRSQWELRKEGHLDLLCREVATVFLSYCTHIPAQASSFTFPMLDEFFKFIKMASVQHLLFSVWILSVVCLQGGYGSWSISMAV